MGGLIAKVEEGDLIELDANTGVLKCHVEDAVLESRAAPGPSEDSSAGIGRELFGLFRKAVSTPETGATIFFDAEADA